MARLIECPNVGDGVTLCGWSDAHAHTVVEVVNARTVILQRDSATRTNRQDDIVSPGGFAAHTESPNGQQWSYEHDSDGRKVKITKRKDGYWRESYTSNPKPVLVGRAEHYDYNF